MRLHIATEIINISKNSVTSGLEPAEYCSITCGRCTRKTTVEESVCCQAMKQNKQLAGGV